MLTGCAQDLIFSEVNRDTVEVLAHNACEVFTPPAQQCCGSLHATTASSAGRRTGTKNIDQFPPEQFDAIISNAGGCGSHLKHYSKLLADDARYRERAGLWDRKLKDVHEWLVEIGIKRPAMNGSSRREEAHASSSEGQSLLTSAATAPLVVTYHESCHLSHGQKVIEQPGRSCDSSPT